MAGRVEAEVIHTARLTLRLPSSDDAVAVTAMLCDFQVARWLTQVPHPYALSDAESYLNAPEPGTWVISDAEGLAGMITVSDKLGYWLAPRVWGRGYIREAAMPLLARHFSAAGAAELIAGCITGNERSLQILTRLGFLPDGSKKITPRSTGTEINLPMFRLTPENWRNSNRLPKIVSPRLQTRELLRDDAPKLIDIAANRHVARNLMSVGLDWSVEEAELWIRQSRWRARPGFRLGVTLWNGRLVGFIGLGPGVEDGPPDTMFALHCAYWGRGMMTEIMGEFLGACFSDFDLSEVDADHFQDNPASGRVLRKLGFKAIGEGVGCSAARLEPAPVSLYRLRRDELVVQL